MTKNKGAKKNAPKNNSKPISVPSITDAVAAVTIITDAAPVIVPTSDPALAATPSPVEGEVVTDQVKAGSDKAIQKNKDAEPVLVAKEFMQPYIQSYPNNKKFFITSDMQVFLQNSEQAAKDHQKSLGEDLTYSTYEV